MAVVSELIDVGLTLKQQGKLKGAIEHFRQLHATYPGNARIMFELAACWSAFDVPEQAVPLYRELIARPKGKGLPAKDLPRLYTRLGAALYALQEYDEALSILDDGLRLHPSYRPLRAYRIFALHAAEMPGNALHDALELMLESLAPSRWDTFEDQIRHIVKAMRDAHDETGIASAASSAQADMPAVENVNTLAAEKSTAGNESDLSDNAPASTSILATKADRSPGADMIGESIITVDHAEANDDDFELDVHVVAKKPEAHKKRQTRRGRGQLGKKSVRIDISAADEEAGSKPEDDAPPAPTGKVQIPIDND